MTHADPYYERLRNADPYTVFEDVYQLLVGLELKELAKIFDAAMRQVVAEGDSSQPIRYGRCGQCDAQMSVRAGSGRRRQFCSDACRQAAHRAQLVH